MERVGRVVMTLIFLAIQAAWILVLIVAGAIVASLLGALWEPLRWLTSGAFLLFVVGPRVLNWLVSVPLMLVIAWQGED